VRKLVVNADDLGMTRGINRAIAEAHDAGIVTSATLMAGSDAFDDAVEIAARRPSLRVGCHLVLVEGHPLADCAEITSLLDPAARTNGTRPQLRASLANFARAATRGLIKAEHVITETVAQIQKLQAAGIKVSHVDCHKHAHMFPRIAEAVIEGARRCGVSTIRAPFEPSWAVFAGGPGSFRLRLLLRSFQVTLLRRWHDPFRQMVRSAGMHTTDGTIGIALTGVLDQRFFNTLIDRMPEGTFEFVCHPGYNDADLARVDTGLLASRELELKVLTSPETRAILAKRRIELINFSELPVKS
jgi:hopanoid biosynthesis associated protein HpnK